jgi:two-component system response regulator (stage 0 sporulation protein A)
MMVQAINRRDDMCVVGLAHDGAAALAGIREAQPDVVLLDLIMPKVDGIGVLEELRSLESVPRPKVIVFSAVGAENLAHEVLQMGADYYIIKPFNIDMVCTRIWQVIHSPAPSPGQGMPPLVKT